MIIGTVCLLRVFRIYFWHIRFWNCIIRNQDFFLSLHIYIKMIFGQSVHVLLGYKYISLYMYVGAAMHVWM